MSEKNSKTRGLGRGLSALMADVVADTRPAAAQPRRPDQIVPIDRLVPNPDQPRRTFDEDALEELTESIRQKGVIQPLIVRASPADAEKYEIVAGERRWRAAQRAQLHDLPVIVRDLTDAEVLEIAIIENIQRADLNPLDQASSYRQLIDRFGHTQDQVATALGKSRSHIANLLRLLTLPPDVLDLVTRGQLTAGHARALVGHENAGALAQTVVRKGLSVRDTEALAKRPNKLERASKERRKPQKDADTRQIEAELTAQLGMPVSIDHAADQDGGKISLSYRSLAQLDDLLRLLSGG